MAGRAALAGSTAGAPASDRSTRRVTGTSVQDIGLIGVVVAPALPAPAWCAGGWCPAPLVAFAVAFAIPLSTPLPVWAVLGSPFVPPARPGAPAIRRAGVTA